MYCIFIERTEHVLTNWIFALYKCIIIIIIISKTVHFIIDPDSFTLTQWYCKNDVLTNYCNYFSSHIKASYYMDNKNVLFWLPPPLSLMASQINFTRSASTYFLLHQSSFPLINAIFIILLLFRNNFRAAVDVHFCNFC